jgi:hypothetical protein
LFQVHSNRTNPRAHPEVYKPLADGLDDEELDDISAEALETVTEKGDEALNSGKDGKPKKDEKPRNKYPSKPEKEATREEMPDAPKQGDEGKNENSVARTG